MTRGMKAVKLLTKIRKEAPALWEQIVKQFGKRRREQEAVKAELLKVLTEPFERNRRPQ